MPLTFSPILIPILLAALTSLFLSWYTWRHRQTTGARSFAFLMTALFLWGVTYVLQAAVTDFEIKIFLYKLTFLWIVVTPVAWFLFALEYTGRRT